VGFFPVFFSAERGLGHGPIHTLPLPVNADPCIVLLEGGLPQLPEEAALLPALEVTVQTTTRAKLGRHGFPVAASAQDVEDAVEHLAVGQARPSALPRATDFGQQGFQALPERIRDTESIDNRFTTSGHSSAPLKNMKICLLIL
jgi:hypothetical protein